jgi:glycosyltransferase involved in cell wall biosynthesis
MTLPVSAVMIVRDGQRFIGEAIASVLGQTYPAIELIVVDDGSTDGTESIVERSIRKRPEAVRLVRHADRGNHGMSASRMLGVAHARGDLIGFLDSDDVWLPAKIEEQVRILERYPEAAMVYGRTQIWSSWTGDGKDGFYELGVEPNRVYGPQQLLPQLVENRVQSPTTCNALLRRSTFEVAGGFEPSFAGLYEDQVFFAKVLLSASTFVSSRVWARYRQHSGNARQTRFSYIRYYRERRQFLEWLADRVAGDSVDATVVRAVQEELGRARHPVRAALAARLGA